ncbi:MAG: indolepyruvate ferredoxin oxidoreductase subunit alpha [Treponema sp.]|jgi:indolepyruvate ferredoxin oxidoreductase alpha subunit|nr:indolepyruvate ferredoxin oxidoreductase subunit alpha [Treponema sp.]
MSGPRTLLGDEALALGAIHAGLSAAYGYPGTPSTEIMEYLQDAAASPGGPDLPAPRPLEDGGGFIARWCANEKTALEAALGTSFSGKRSLVTMKHVGLNVAADPFMNGSLLGIRGGLVIVVADDPGMHSSQGEQDSRFYASFAMVPCLEPRSQQEAYDMAREAFDLSEGFHLPVMIRLVTRLSHARAAVRCSPPGSQNPLSKAEDKTEWMLLPVYARKNYAALLEKQEGLRHWSEEHPANRLELENRDAGYAVITSGLGGNYYEENLADFAAARGKMPVRLHIGAYPLPEESLRRLCTGAGEVLILEEGQPFIEERIRGILPQTMTVRGRLGPGENAVPRTGELDPDNVRAALGLPPRRSVLDAVSSPAPPLVDPALIPPRPPQLCAGCPHADSYETINRAAAALDPSPDRSRVSVNSDIGCYSLGASPPYSAVESIVCMGASIGMARGAAEAGIPYAFAVIGDSTFIHSGLPALIDAVEAEVSMTVIILDNSAVAMTGCQKTALPSARLTGLILGTGLDPAHCLELEAKKQFIEENAAALQREAEHRGPSVVILRRECLEAARKRIRRPAAGV